MRLPLPIFLLPTLALSLPSSLQAKDIIPTGQTVKQDILNINTAVLSLSETVTNFQGGAFPTSLVTGTPVLLGVAGIHIANRAGFVHALAALPFSVADSDDVIDAVVDTVNISIPASTKIIEGKLPQFKEGGLVPTVIASLKLLLNDHDTFSDAVVAKLNSGIGAQKAAEGQAAIENIHNVIQEAIDYYTANGL